MMRFFHSLEKQSYMIVKSKKTLEGVKIQVDIRYCLSRLINRSSPNYLYIHV